MNDLDPKPPTASPLKIWDLLSILVLLMTVCIGGYFLMIFINPGTPLNPFPPLPTAFQFPTATMTPIQLEPTWTASPLPPMTATDTARPTFTAFPTSTLFSLIPPSKTPPPTATPKAPYSTTINYYPSTFVHPEAGCNWVGIGGNATALGGGPDLYKIVQIGGVIHGEVIDPNNFIRVTGSSKLYASDASFEFVLGNTPADSLNTLWIRLTDLSGASLSDTVYFKTYSDCSKNLVFVRFQQTR